MRSLLLSQLSRLSLRKPPALGHLGCARYLSQTPLCRIVGAERCGSTPRDGDIGRLVVTDVSESSYGTEVLEKKVPMELMTETGTIGASHGWVATLKDGVVRLQDDLNPSASDSDPKRISLPPLVTLPHCQTQLVTNVAMSSSSPEDDDCIVAVKFLGPQLSLCRPAQKNPEWVNIRVEDPGFSSSKVMYSKRDDMFSMPASGGTHICSWDLDKHRHKPKLQTLRFPNHPEFVQSEWVKLDKCSRIEDLVESRATGEVFMVKRFKERKNYEVMRMEEKQMLVFKLDGNGNALYTEDIGDLCIFLSSKGEPFCLQASLYDVLENHVYFTDSGQRGLFDIRCKYVIGGFVTYPAPYYIPPQSYLNAISNNGGCISISS
ncbi:PREDICTED: uncharacterized protein LOC104727581 [Camelina sativa]|uniref:Uncharacterized protein LOC104727581 n=1 Tax=Camelina sativa TaxID=90675 RepID=A0ABM0URF1_CAMSA|nr:PREDICTED: uncharacterized protein LOC104727581 [Camelina sativa]